MPSHSFSFLTWNIETNLIRLEEGLARETHAAWRSAERAPCVAGTLRRLVDAHRPAVLHIQECRRCKTRFGFVDSVTIVTEALSAAGYVALVSPFAEDYRGFLFVTAFDPKQLTHEDGYLRYLTQTPHVPTPRPPTQGLPEAEVQRIEAGIKANNMGVFWERGVFINRFRSAEFEEPLYTLNVHTEVLPKLRVEQAGLVHRFALEILQEAPNARLIAAGDFNTLPDDITPRQLAAVQGHASLDGDAVFTEASKDLRLQDGRPVDFSFIAYPYDMFWVTYASVRPAIGRLQDAEARRLAEEALSAFSEKTFTLVKFCEALPPAAREAVIWSFFDDCMPDNGQLDRVFARHLSVKEAVLELTPTRPLEGIDPLDQDQLRQFVSDAAHRVPAFASDHQPVVVRFEL